MNTLMILLHVDYCCAKACGSNCSTFSAWNGLIKWLPWLFFSLLAFGVIIAFIKYGVEYNKTNKEYLFKAQSEEKQHKEESKSFSELNNAIQGLTKKLDSIDPIESKLREDVNNLETLLDTQKEENINYSWNCSSSKDSTI